MGTDRVEADLGQVLVTAAVKRSEHGDKQKPAVQAITPGAWVWSIYHHWAQTTDSVIDGCFSQLQTALGQKSPA